MVSSGPSDLGPGARVGEFVVGERLGEGASSIVYAATAPRDRKSVAIKVLKHASADESDAERMLREARVVEGIRHPAIVDVFAHGRLPDGRPYLVMPRLEGRTLEAALAAHGRYAPADAWRIVREVAAALGAAHAAGVVHRDLKPENVFLEDAPSGTRPRVLDFGLARSDPHPSEVAVSQTGRPVGTPLYMAPEQWWGRGVDARTDQYALGAVFFELLTGAPPFSAATYVDMLEAHLHRAPPSLAAKGVEASAALEALVARLLAKSNEERFASMTDVIAAGDAACGFVANEHAPAVVTAPARRAAFDAAPLLVLAIGSAAAIAIGYAGEAPHDPRAWLAMAGLAGPVMALFAAIFAAVAALRRTRAAAAVLATLALAAAPGAHFGWNAVERNVAAVEPAARFLLVHVGAYEASAVRFVGAALLALAFVVVSWGAPLRGEAPRLDAALRARDLGFAAGAALALGAAGIAAGAPALAFVGSITASVTAGAMRVPPTSLRREATRIAAGVLAVGFALVAALARVDGREGFAWTDALTRAERADALFRTSQERSVTWGLGAACLLLAGGIAIARATKLVRAGRSRALLVPRGPGVVALALALAFFALDAAYVARVASARRVIADALAPQFALFAQLDPPTTSLAGAPHAEAHAAPALQVSREVIAVQAHRVARLDALATPAAASAIANALCPAIADGTGRERDAPDLSLLVDASTPAAALARLLALARDCGAQRLELLLARGARATLSPHGPHEAAFVVPSDFVAVPLRLAPEGLDLPSPDASALARAAESSARDGRVLAIRMPAAAK